MTFVKKVILVATGVLATILISFAINPGVTRGAILYEQTDMSTLGETASAHPNNTPTQKLGTGLNGAVSSISYRLHGNTIADDLGNGWGAFLLYSCSSDSYIACPLATSTPSNAHIISQSGNDAYILATTSSPYLFNPTLYYYLKWVITGDMALYGASTTTQDTYANGIAQWFDGVFHTEANISDVAFRICDTADCDIAPDIVAPVLAEVAAISTSTNTTPTYEFTSTEAGALAFGGVCVAATSTVGIGTTTLTFDALVVGTYATCSLSVTDRAGNMGTLSVSPFTIEDVPITPAEPALPVGGGGGSNGIIGGPLGVGYQTTYFAPAATIPVLAAPPPATPAPQPAQVIDIASQVRVPETSTPAPAKNQTSDVQTQFQAQVDPEPAVTNITTNTDTPLYAAAATSGFELPIWTIAIGMITLMVLGITWTIRLLQ